MNAPRGRARGPRVTRWSLRRAALAAALAVGALVPWAPPAAAQAEDATCLLCHSEVQTPATRAAKSPGFEGAHGEVACVDCHMALYAWDPEEEFEHEVPLPAASCTVCHGDVAGELAGGPHNDGKVSCQECHGAHDLRGFDLHDMTLATGRLNALCTRCHVDVVRAGEDDIHAAAFQGRTCLACHDAHDTSPPQPEVNQQVCLMCHESDEATEGNGFAPPASVTGSVHAGLTCVLCHTSIRETGELPHEDVAPVNCGTCHPQVAEACARGLHDRTLESGVRAADCRDCHGTHDILPKTDPRSRAYPRNQPETCARCHNGHPPEDRPAPAGDEVDRYRSSIHGRLLLEQGLLVSATCSSCHGAHDIRPGEDAESATSRRHVPYTCGSCHAGVLEGYLAGVHGETFLAGSTDVPVCTDCHQEHTIEDPALASSSASEALVAQTCARCHADDELAQDYGFSSTVLTSWAGSYHGIAGSFGASGVANCASCHGYHAVFPSSDPRSSVHASNLEATCGTCHPNSTAAFAKVPVHSVVDRESNFVPWIVRTVYAVLIGAVIGAFVLFILFDLWGRLRIRMGWGPPETEHVDPEEWPDEDELVAPEEKFERMPRIGRLQHGILVLSFTLLVLTGLPVFLHESTLFRSIIELEGGYLLRSKLHRIAAVGLIGLSLWHVGMLLVSGQARRWFALMVAKPRDVTQFLQESMFSLGVLPWLSRRRALCGLFERFPSLACRERPAYGRYGLVEKLEYWAVVWGNFVMILSGLILWRPDWFLGWTPDWTFDVTRVVHGFEATLAFLAIIIWHMYHVHLRPGVFPMSRVWLDGKISRKELRHHHPAEYRRILERRRRERQPGAPSGR